MPALGHPGEAEWRTRAGPSVVVCTQGGVSRFRIGQFALCQWAPGLWRVRSPRGCGLGVWTWAAGEGDWLTSNQSLKTGSRQR